MKIKRRKIAWLTIVLIALSPLTLTGCGINKNSLNLGDHGYFLKRNIQDNAGRKHLICDNVTAPKIPGYTSDIDAYFHTRFLSGGYKEVRYFYGRESQIAIAHAGVDNFVSAGTPIYAPVSGEIVASYWAGESPRLFATGIGSVLVEKTSVNELLKEHIIEPWKATPIYLKDQSSSLVVERYAMQFVDMGEFGTNYKPNPKKLNIPKGYSRSSRDKYQAYLKNLSIDQQNKIKKNNGVVYISFIHMSKSSPQLLTPNNKNAIKVVHDKPQYKDGPIPETDYNTLISPQHPLAIKKGQQIGIVGTQKENGGWMSHTHVEVSINNSQDPWFEDSKIDQYITQWNKVIYFDKQGRTCGNLTATPMSTQVLIGNPNTYASQIAPYFWKHGMVDPNDLFKLYDSTTAQVHMT